MLLWPRKPAMYDITETYPKLTEHSYFPLSTLSIALMERPEIPDASSLSWSKQGELGFL